MRKAKTRDAKKLEYFRIAEKREKKDQEKYGDEFQSSLFKKGLFKDLVNQFECLQVEIRLVFEDRAGFAGYTIEVREFLDSQKALNFLEIEFKRIFKKTEMKIETFFKDAALKYYNQKEKRMVNVFKPNSPVVDLFVREL